MKWYKEIIERFGHKPNDNTLRQAWFELTGQVLSDNALVYLRNYIEEQSNSV